jgi:hypothetical protein
MKKTLSIILVFALLGLNADPYVKELRLTPEGKIIDIVLDFDEYELMLTDEGYIKAIVNKIKPATVSADIELKENEFNQDGSYCYFDKKKRLEYIEEKLVLYDPDSSGRIDNIGHMRIIYRRYYGSKEKIKSIGNLDLDYNLLIERVDRINKFNVRYDLNSKKIWRIYRTDTTSCGFVIKIINPYQVKK